jgi:adenylate kinase
LRENLLLFGPPGVGKGTQAHRLASAFRIPHIATGDILRAAIQSHAPLGRRVAAFIDRGQLVPDDIMVEVVRDRLGRPDTASGFLLDGFPRTIPQAEQLPGLLPRPGAEHEPARGPGQDIDGVVVLEAPTEALVARIAGRRTCESCQASYHVTSRPPRVDGVCDRCGGVLIQRNDDAEATVRYRLGEYAAKTEPVLDHFRARGWPMRVIDAMGDIDQVFGRIYSAVLLG